MSTIAIIQAIILIYFIYWQPDIGIRTMIANASAAALMACSLLVIPFKDKELVNRLLFWVSAATSIQFLLRSVFVFYMAQYQGLAMTDANYAQSIVTVSLHFSIAVLSLIMGVTACIAFGLDAISDIKKMVDVDVLSGLPNQHKFETEAHKILKLAKEKNLPVTLILMDLDKYKSVNDKHGQIICNEIIHNAGKKIRALCNQNHTAGRIGFDKFSILLDTADIKLGRLMAESLRQEMESQTFTTNRETISITASFGVAELRDNENYNTVFSRANEELDKAKQMGRNQVRPKRANYILQSVI